MASWLLVLVLIISGILAVLFLLLLIISFTSDKKRKGIVYTVSCIGALCLALYCISEMIGRIKTKVASGLEWAREHEKEFRDVITESEEESKSYIDTLRSYVPSNLQKEIPSNFYSGHDPAKNVYTIPLVYPYRIEMIGDTWNEGYLADIGKNPKIKDTISAITQIAFDRNFLLLKRDYSSAATKPRTADFIEVTYALFDFKTGRAQVFTNQQSLFSEAEKRGYTGQMYLDLIDDVYRRIARPEAGDY